MNTPNNKRKKESQKKIEETVVDGYKKVEETVVGGYKKVEDKFVDKFLRKDGETIEEAKERIKKEQEENYRRIIINIKAYILNKSM